MSLATTYFYLAIAIIAEVIATSALKASEGFSRLWPSVITVVGYGIAFWCLSLTLKVIPTGIVYAIWSGVGANSSMRRNAKPAPISVLIVVASVR